MSVNRICSMAATQIIVKAEDIMNDFQGIRNLLHEPRTEEAGKEIEGLVNKAWNKLQDSCQWAQAIREAGE